MLQDDLGDVYTAKQVADYFGMNVKTVRDNYRQLGGIRIGSKYIFFSKGISNAIQTRQEVHRTGQEKQQQEGERVQHQERSPSLGSRDAEADRRRVERSNKHGLLD